MEFVETSIFSKQIVELIEEEEYRKPQNFLLENPKAAPVIPDTGGARKLRRKSSGKGKGGGIRTIYLFKEENNKLYMLLAYQKGCRII